jgi:hypothetical protein
VSDHPAVRYTLYPLTLYHPVLGAVTVENQEDALKTFVPPHDWFHTAAEADAHRTDREAMMVIHNTRRMQVDDMAAHYDAVASGDPDALAKAAAERDLNRDDKSPVPPRGTVTHSVSHTEDWVKPQAEELQKTDEDKQAENEAIEKAAQDRRAATADLEHVVVVPEG